MITHDAFVDEVIVERTAKTIDFLLRINAFVKFNIIDNCVDDEIFWFLTLQVANNRHNAPMNPKSEARIAATPIVGAGPLVTLYAILQRAVQKSTYVAA